MRTTAKLARLLGLSLALLGSTAIPVYAQAVMRLPAGFEAATFLGNDETLSCMKGGTGPTIMLLHGWPETANEWDGVAAILARTNTVYACDLPGIRASTNVDDDFSKAGMADDMHAAFQAAGIGPFHLVGHDIGLMVAYSYASAFPDDVLTLMVLDAPLPGTPVFDAISSDPRAWHFTFHNVEAVPEMVVGNSVGPYLEHFIKGFWASKTVSPDAMIADSIAAYEDPATLRSGFEFYRAFEQDGKDNSVKARTKLPMPVLALNAGANSPQPYVLAMMKELGVNVSGGAIEGAGHWLSHEATDELAERIAKFTAANDG